MCQQHYPDWEAVACASFEDVFAAVENGDADLAMIPIDNSIAGRVADIHHFLPDSRPAHHRRALPAHPVRADGRRRAPTLDTIKTVHSHVHALGQCRKVIRELGLTPIVSGDTAGAAREVAEAAGPDPGRDRAAAGRGDLRPARSCATTSRTRTTTPRGSSCSPATSSRRPADDGPVVTSFIFNVRNLPAALYKALGGFATNGVNMTKLESYMVGGQFTATQFLAEVDGHPEDPGVKNALEELAFFTTDVKVLGVYPADAFRARVPAGLSPGGFCISVERRALRVWRTAIRPMPGTSKAGATTVPPSSLGPAPTVASTSSTLK